MDLSGRPLFDNPGDAALFVDRDEAARLEENCRDNVNTLLLGDRGMGKTTLLRHVLFRLRESDFPAIGIDGSPVEDSLGLVRLIAAALGRAAVGPRPLDPGAVGLGEVGLILNELRSLGSDRGA